MKVISTTADVNGTSLQGYIEATYDQLVELFGSPRYNETSSDGKVDVEWTLELSDGRFNTVCTIYNWKDGDGGDRARSGRPYRWHVGGTGLLALSTVQKFIGA